MKALPVLLAVLVALPAVVTGAFVPTAASSPSVGTDATTGSLTDGTTVRADDANQSRIHVLAIPGADIRRSTHARHHVDLGPTASFAANATAARLRTYTVVERIESTDDPDARERQIRQALQTIEQQIPQLRAREQAAFAAYNAGDISQRQLLIRLAHIDAEARALANRTARLGKLTVEAEDEGISQSRILSLQRSLQTLTGPVRHYAVEVLRGEAPPTRFYVETSANSVVLSAITNRTYVREAYRGDLHQQGSQTIPPERALNITAQSYPTVWESNRNNTEIVEFGNSYLVTVPHQRGSLVAFIDGDSEAVFKEYQRRPLSTMGTGKNVSAVKDGLRLSVNRTYRGGPLRIQLHDIETGEPVDANITIGQGGAESVLVGRTGDDGTLWTLSPRGRFTITAIKGNSVVVLTMRPVPPPRIKDARSG